MKTSELTGITLDWAVAKCEGVNEEAFRLYYMPTEPSDLDTNGYPEFHYSTIWAQGGPIIEREHIGLLPSGNAYYQIDGGTYYSYGPTPLIAAMRCYVMSRFGDEIEIPQELFE